MLNTCFLSPCESYGRRRLGSSSRLRLCIFGQIDNTTLPVSDAAYLADKARGFQD